MAGKGSPKGVKQGVAKHHLLNKSTAEIKELAQGDSVERTTVEPKHDTTQAD